MFGHQDFFLRELEAGILKHVYFGGQFEKWPPLRLNVRICDCIFCNTWSLKCIFISQNHFPK